MDNELKSLAPIALPDALLEELARLYSTPPRAYHSLDHVVEVARLFTELTWQRPREIFVALLFHDAIYEAGRMDNEQRSADVAREAIMKHAIEVDAARVAELILLTAKHGRVDQTLDADAAQLLDVDMAIVGSDAPRYARYEAGIAQEYAALPREAYRAGRIAFLTKLRSSPRIYHTDVMHQRFEHRARANLARALGLAEIVQAGTPVLRARALEVDPTMIATPEMQALFQRMIDAMRAAPGVGLAAPQLGIGLRVFVLEDRPEYLARSSERESAERERVPVAPRILVNPTLVPVGDEKVGFLEGCLSVDGWVGYVERWREVEVKALDEHGVMQTWRTRGWPARILQHEYDHLEGTLYIDRMLTRSFTDGRIAQQRFAGKSAAEVRALLGVL